MTKKMFLVLALTTIVTNNCRQQSTYNPWGIFDEMDRMYQDMMQANQQMLAGLPTILPNTEKQVPNNTLQVTMREENDSVTLITTTSVENQELMDLIKNKQSTIHDSTLTVPIPHGSFKVQTDPYTNGTQLSYWIEQTVSHSIHEKHEAPITTISQSSSYSSTHSSRTIIIPASLNITDAQVSYERKGKLLTVSVTIPKRTNSRTVIIPSISEVD